MEHRWNARMPYNETVWLDARHVSIRASARDIGFGGMFVETGAVLLPLYTPVFVRLQAAWEAHPCELRFPAVVVRRTAGGVGLMFLETSNGTGAALLQALAGESLHSLDRPPLRAAIA